ncbi:MAG TPA: adenylate/guanylate cyclase domain-containing protein, partial [Candidatus Obscuribacterales bacterium]
MKSNAEPIEFSRSSSSKAQLLLIHSAETMPPDLVATLDKLGFPRRVMQHQALAPDFFETHDIDLILLEALPTGDGSYTLCQGLKENRTTRDIPVVMVGDRVPQQISAAFGAGASDYLCPPFWPAEVLARIEYHINGYRRRQQLSEQNQLLLDEVRERKQMEDALRQTEEKYRRIFENATEGIFQTSREGRFISVNPALAQIYGYDSPDELMAQVTDVGTQLYTQPKRRDELIVYLQQFETITGSESEVFRKDGSKIWISETLRKVYDNDGNFLYYEGIVHDITEKRCMEMELRQQRRQADRLLGNILPYQIATRLKTGTRTIAESFNEVTVLFADLVEFTAASGQMAPKELVELLNEVFSNFDRLAEKHGLEKIKTIGDAYMAAAGLPVPRPDHVDAVALMALDMQQAIAQFTRPNGEPFQLRIGINTGPVIAGVIGMRKFAYDLWGDTVNIASRMETTGVAGRIQV